MLSALIIFLFLLLLSLIFFGYYIKKNKNADQKFKFGLPLKTITGSSLFLIIAVTVAIFFSGNTKLFSSENPEENAKQTETVNTFTNITDRGLGFLGVAIAVGIGSLGAGIATGMASAAAIGAVSEDPKSFANSIIFVGLSEGIAIYGLVIAIMILSKI